MAITVDFEVSSRVGNGYLNAVFTDISTGTIVSRKWILGDGTVIEGNETQISYTYKVPGIYTVSLVAFDGTEQVTEIKTNYIYVNEIYDVPKINIIESYHQPTGKYWKLYFSSEGYFIYEDQDKIYRSEDVVLNIKRWTFIELHGLSKTLYLGTGTGGREKLNMLVFDNTAPDTVTETITKVCSDCTLKTDELLIWKKYIDLEEYFNNLRGRLINIDRL